MDCWQIQTQDGWIYKSQDCRILEEPKHIWACLCLILFQASLRRIIFRMSMEAIIFSISIVKSAPWFEEANNKLFNDLFLSFWSGREAFTTIRHFVCCSVRFDDWTTCHDVRWMICTVYLISWNNFWQSVFKDLIVRIIDKIQMFRFDRGKNFSPKCMSSIRIVRQTLAFRREGSIQGRQTYQHFSSVLYFVVFDWWMSAWISTT